MNSQLKSNVAKNKSILSTAVFASSVCMHIILCCFSAFNLFLEVRNSNFLVKSFNWNATKMYSYNSE